jgi:hypothetical protein
MKVFLFILLSLLTEAYKVININTLIKRPIEDSIISFIKINNLNNIRIKNHSSYLILKFSDEVNKKPVNKLSSDISNNLISINESLIILLKPQVKKEEKTFYDIYNIIKNNNKPLMIINNKNLNNLKSKYVYLIKSRTEYFIKYSFDYNNKKNKYYLDIIANPIDKYETLWDISAIIDDISSNDKLIMLGNNIKNWIEYQIYQLDTFNDLYKKYMILYYFLNIKSNEL